MNEPYDCEHGNSCYTCKDCTIKELTAQLAEWHKVFGHLSKDADTAGNIINEGIADNAENARKQAARDALKWMIQNYCINERMANDFCTKFKLEG